MRFGSAEKTGKGFSKRDGSAVCVAGDLNVNLGGPHYYGSSESKEAVADAFEDSDLIPMTDYERVKSPEFDAGLIDHIAVSSFIGNRGTVLGTLPKRSKAGPMSDHVGVVVSIS